MISIMIIKNKHNFLSDRAQMTYFKDLVPGSPCHTINRSIGIISNINFIHIENFPRYRSIMAVFFSPALFKR